MELTSLKLTKEERKDTMGACCRSTNPPDGPKFPWGLQVTLEDESLKKMEISLADYSVGDVVELKAVCKVTRLSQSEREGDGKNRTMELQIMAMGLEPAEEEEAESDEIGWDEDSHSSEVDQKLRKRYE